MFREGLLNDSQALQFARKHMETWNSHDLDSIIALYSDSIELISPLAASIRGHACVRGKKDLREYFAEGLKKFTDLRFEIVNTYRCESCVTIVYRAPKGGLVAEVLFIGGDGKIEKVFAHYVCGLIDKNAS